MSDSDSLRRSPLHEKGADGLREAGKDKAEMKATNLSLAEIMSQQEKTARSKDHLPHDNLVKDALQSQKGKSTSPEYTSFDILASMGFIRALGAETKSAEFKWQAAKSNFLELPKEFGRKLLQLKQAELKELKQLKEEKEDLEHKRERPLKANKELKDLDEPKPVDKAEDKWTDQEKDEQQDKEQEEEIAIDLNKEKIYDEKDYREEIKRATELSLGIDEAHTEGKKVFKSLEQVRPHDMGQATIAAYGHLSRKRLRECIQNLANGRVIVVGDLLVDELLEGSPERISREAPVLILEHIDTVLIPGGAANTAHNISSLGGSCHAIGVCGKDDYASKLASILEANKVTHSLIQDPSRPTTVKTRILSKSHAFQQQLLRLDRISHAPISSVIETLLANKLEQVAGQYRALILSDYRAGAITDGIIQSCRKTAASKQLLLVIDAQENFERFQNATLLTPNQPDAEKAVGFTFDSPESLKRGGNDLLLLTGAQALLITRGSEGMVLFRKGQEPFELPAFNRSQVFDVTGAGDTVVATMTLALVTGSSFEEAMALGNLAAGIVVRKAGTAVTTQAELAENLELIPLAEE